MHLTKPSSARPVALLVLLGVTAIALAMWPAAVSAQSVTPGVGAAGSGSTPVFWYVLAAAVAMLLPAGVALLSLAGLTGQRAWNAALSAATAVGLAGVAYWAFGFALQFGGIGLVYPQTGLRFLVWEWSPLSTEWGIGWGMAGLSGWFLSGPEVTPLAYGLFLAHLPWVMTAAILPVTALRGRAPLAAAFVLPLFIGGAVYPLAGNWVQGGGWLSALGRNLSLGHGLVDFGGAGTVFLVSASFSLAALVVWPVRRSGVGSRPVRLEPAQMPLLAVVGGLFVLGGVIGWFWSNPLQAEGLGELAILRGSVNAVLSAGAGTLAPLLYTWFVTGLNHPTVSARGLAAGAVAGMAAGPFVQPGSAFLIGLLAGAAVPLVSYLVDGVLHLDDATGVVASAGLPAVIGLLLTGIFADGVAGQGFQMTGIESYLGVADQGVTGLFAAQGFQPAFPAQLQAQLIGILTLALWGFLCGMVICAPLGLLLHGLQEHEETLRAPAQPAYAAEPPARPPVPELAGRPLAEIDRPMERRPSASDLPG